MTSLGGSRLARGQRPALGDCLFPLISPSPTYPYLTRPMGWFGSTKAEKPNAISREDRSKCWEARDAYFACLDAAEVVVAGTEGSKCASQRKFYEQNCAKSWVSSISQHARIICVEI